MKVGSPTEVGRKSRDGIPLVEGLQYRSKCSAPGPTYSRPAYD